VTFAPDLVGAWLWVARARTIAVKERMEAARAEAAEAAEAEAEAVRG
jgi:hypothetical protein